MKKKCNVVGRMNVSIGKNDLAAPPLSSSSADCLKTDRKLQKWKVSFGNPALGRFDGCVYTIVDEKCSADSKYDSGTDSDARDMSSIEEDMSREKRFGGNDEECSRIVAMVDVPPEEVPEGVLNFARSHRSCIEHVRVVVSKPDSAFPPASPHIPQHKTGHPCDHPDHLPLPSPSAPFPAMLSQQSASAGSPNNYYGTRTSSLSSVLSNSLPGGANATAMEDAASIMAADEAAEASKTHAELEQKNKKKLQSEHRHRQQLIAETARNKHGRQRTYLVLFALRTASAAKEFADDLNGRPYTSLQADVTCSVYRVAALQGEGGGVVSLMSPFFASLDSSGGVSIPAPLPVGNPPTPSLGRSGSDNARSGVSSTQVSGDDLNGKENGMEKDSGKLRPSTFNSVMTMTATPQSTNAATPTLSAALIGTEIHNCAVCLERMEFPKSHFRQGCRGRADGSSSPQMVLDTSASIITTVCNHSFHIDCLLRWQDSPCPVCRYDHSGLNETLSQCHVCGTTEHNYVCLICGVVSCCGSASSSSVDGGATSFLALPDEQSMRTVYSGDADNSQCVSDGQSASNNRRLGSISPLVLNAGHAQQHYDETLHAYALDTQTQHVWDFAGQGYVHRLIQNAEDGKLVEVNDPSNTTSQERSLSPGLSDAQEGEVVHRKLEGFASQYYTLLKSQLEQQRMYYEGRLEEIRRDHNRTLFGPRTTTTNGINNHGKRYGKDGNDGSSADLISALKQERNQLEQRCATLRKKHQKVCENVAFLKNLNESLEGNKERMRHQIMEANRERIETRDMIRRCLPPLEEKVRSLMFQLEKGCGYSESNVLSSTGVHNSDDRKPAARRR